MSLGRKGQISFSWTDRLARQQIYNLGMGGFETGRFRSHRDRGHQCSKDSGRVIVGWGALYSEAERLWEVRLL
jgi:hypothetical protein